MAAALAAAEPHPRRPDGQRRSDGRSHHAAHPPIGQARFPVVGTFAAVAWMVAIDLVKDKQTKALRPRRTPSNCRARLPQGLLLLGCGESAGKTYAALTVQPEHIDFP